MKKNPLLKMLEKRQSGINAGIPSFCCANKMVIEVLLEQAKFNDDFVLIEATSNQVNQFGGYMGMTPYEFKEYVYSIAKKVDFDEENILLGGDHLGPQPWQDLCEREAMENSKKLVYDCVKAGYHKIHLDTSMRVKDDALDEQLSTRKIAERGAILYKECEKAYLELLKENPNVQHPVFVIGSEVPIPGGTQNEEEKLQVTNPEDFENTLLTYKEVFTEYNLEDAWKYIIAVVVQPGVEFGSKEIHEYNREESKNLCKKLNEYPGIVFEGHSTDYQPAQKLKELVEDGIAILKVGPALTYAFREGLFALCKIEEELIQDVKERSHLEDTLEKVMLENPKNWINHYHGDETELKLERKYSFSDRSRYYFNNIEVESAINKLFKNLSEKEIPLFLIHQYLPKQYIKVRDKLLENNPRELVKDNILTVIEEYNYAVKQNYIISSLFIK